MPLLHLSTEIKAPKQLVFDLARNIDFHQKDRTLSESHNALRYDSYFLRITQGAMRLVSKCPIQTQEKAIAGRTSGLIELGEWVTWEGVHFGIKQQLTTQITAMNAPHSFRDEMLDGTFKSIKHEHFFYEEKGATIMVDLFHFELPLGLLGQLANVLFLKRHMYQFLHIRNQAIKKEAEKLVQL